MKIVVSTRTLNESDHVEGFMKSYSWADIIVVIDGGSTDDTVKKLLEYSKVKIYVSPYRVEKNGYWHNPDNPNINYALQKGLDENPDFHILDDSDDFPNIELQKNARKIIEECQYPQINAFRFYMWNKDHYYPKMNNYFDINYTSIWGYYPNRMKIWADENVEHGTILGLTPNNYKIELPNCLLHYSWNSETIDKKIKRYNAIGLPMNRLEEFAGEMKPIEEWMRYE